MTGAAHSSRACMLLPFPNFTETYPLDKALSNQTPCTHTQVHHVADHCLFKGVLFQLPSPPNTHTHILTMY